MLCLSDTEVLLAVGESTTVSITDNKVGKGFSKEYGGLYVVIDPEIINEDELVANGFPSIGLTEIYAIEPHTIFSSSLKGVKSSIHTYLLLEEWVYNGKIPEGENPYYYKKLYSANQRLICSDALAETEGVLSVYDYVITYPHQNPAFERWTASDNIVGIETKGGIYTEIDGAKFYYNQSAVITGEAAGTTIISVEQSLGNGIAVGQVAVTVYTKGDVNNDGLVNPFDAALVLRYDAQLIDGFDIMQAADVNSDTKVSPFDASLILRYDAMLIDSFPKE